MFIVLLEIEKLEQILFIASKIPDKDISKIVSSVKFTGEYDESERANLYLALLNKFKFSHYQLLSEVQFTNKHHQNKKFEDENKNMFI